MEDFEPIRLADCSRLYPHTLHGENCPACWREVFPIREPLPRPMGLFQFIWLLAGRGILGLVLIGWLTVPAHAQSAAAQPILTVSESNRMRIIDWTPWHKRLAEAVRPACKFYWQRVGNPVAAAEVLLVVHRDHHLDIDVLSSSSPVAALVAGRIYAQLDGLDILEYPAGSQRQTFSYVVRTECTGRGPAITYWRTDDQEIVRE